MARLPALALAAALAAAGCSSSDAGTVIADGSDAEGESTTTVAEATPTTEATTTSVGGTQESGDSGASGEVAGALPIDASWEELDERWFVFGVAADDVLNVRSAPGADNDILTTLSPDAEEVVRYSEVVAVGETSWTPVAIPGGAGWVALDFIKPTPSLATPTISGVPNVDEALLESVLAAVGDPVALAEFVGGEGLVLAPDQFVSPETVKLTADELRSTGDDARIWGESDGEGGPIELTLNQFMAGVAGSTALTSTEQIGYDEVVSSGNLINNITETFPGARVVEQYFGGTNYFGGLDWESVSLVFDSEDNLIAIVQGAWTV